jgi:hypothetical protein
MNKQLHNSPSAFGQHLNKPLVMSTNSLRSFHLQWSDVFHMEFRYEQTFPHSINKDLSGASKRHPIQSPCYYLDAQSLKLR